MVQEKVIRPGIVARVIGATNLNLRELALGDQQPIKGTVRSGTVVRVVAIQDGGQVEIQVTGVVPALWLEALE